MFFARKNLLLVSMVMKLETESFDRVILRIYSRHSKHQWHRNNAEHREVIQQHDNIVWRLLESFVCSCLILQFEPNRNRISRRIFSLRESNDVDLVPSINNRCWLRDFPVLNLDEWLLPNEEISILQQTSNCYSPKLIPFIPRRIW